MPRLSRRRLLRQSVGSPLTDSFCGAQSDGQSFRDCFTQRIALAFQVARAGCLCPAERDR